MDPVELSPEDRADTPSYLFDLVTARDGQLVGRPVNQFVQLACFNKERLSSPPQTLKEMDQESEGSPTNELQAEADSDPANDSAGETP